MMFSLRATRPRFSDPATAPQGKRRRPARPASGHVASRIGNAAGRPGYNGRFADVPGHVGPANTKQICEGAFCMQIPEHGSYSITIASRLRSPAERVWAHASTFADTNRELCPWAA